MSGQELCNLLDYHYNSELTIGGGLIRIRCCTNGKYKPYTYIMTRKKRELKPDKQSTHPRNSGSMSHQEGEL